VAIAWKLFEVKTTLRSDCEGRYSKIESQSSFGSVIGYMTVDENFTAVVDIDEQNKTFIMSYVLLLRITWLINAPDFEDCNAEVVETQFDGNLI
jgi:hypothetical protein